MADSPVVVRLFILVCGSSFGRVDFQDSQPIGTFLWPASFQGHFQMMKRIRLVLGWAIFLLYHLITGQFVKAQTVEDALDEILRDGDFSLDGELLTEQDLAELLGDDDLADLLEQRNWELDLKFRSGFGYGDNVLYGAYEKMGSGYLFGAIDGFYYRNVEDSPWNAFLYFYGEHLEYFEDVDAGRLYVTQGQVSRLTANQDKTFGLSATHIFYDQVFDASADLDTFDTFGVSAHQYEAVPFVDFHFQGGWLFRAEGMFGGSRYEDSYDDSDSVGGLLKLKRTMGKRSDVSLEYSYEARDYLEKVNRDFEGYSVGGLLNLKVGIAMLQYRLQPKEDGWAYRTQLSHYTQRDGEDGYTDYDRVRVSQSASKAWDKWDLLLSARHTWYDYPVRTAEFGSTETLYRRALEANANLSWDLSEDSAVFLETQFERNESNSADNVFSASRVVLGVEWSL
jgi:hypothetical protein